MTRKMKDSGIEWIGEIPEKWDVSKLKYFIKVGSGKGISKDEFSDAGEYPVIGSNGKIGRSSKCNLSEERLIVGRVGAVGSLNIAKNCWVTDNALIVTNDDNIISTRYLYYSLHNIDFLAFNTGTAQPLMTGTQLKNTILPYVSLKEQNCIVTYLDHKCNKIDEAIEKQKQVIEKLKAYKQSVITEAVTKGLNPNVSMKNSGIKWIGEIPEHWKLCRLKNLLAIPMQYGANDSGEEFNENEPRYIRITDITMDNKLTDDGKLSLPLDRAEQYLLENGDILFARSGATVGKTFIYKKEFGRSAFAGYLVKAKFNEKALPEFVFYYTLSNSYIEWKNQIFIQATIQNIGANKYSNMEIVMTSEEEQNKIVNYLDNKCTKIDNAVAKKETLIEKLVEYKKSLIYECVTGKREV